MTSLRNNLRKIRPHYLGAIVLGLNDAIVEMTGAIAGLTYALLNTQLVGIVSLITGIAASLSMASSEYLSQKSEGFKKPFRVSLYTGIAYFLTVLALVFPHFIFTKYYLALGLTLFNAVLIIFVFTYFIPTAKGYSFKSRFFEMTFISLGVALVSFLAGLAVRLIFNIEV